MNAGNHFPVERNKLGDKQIKTKSAGRNVQAYGSARFISWDVDGTFSLLYQ